MLVLLQGVGAGEELIGVGWGIVVPLPFQKSALTLLGFSVHHYPALILLILTRLHSN